MALAGPTKFSEDLVVMRCERWRREGGLTDAVRVEHSEEGALRGVVHQMLARIADVLPTVLTHPLVIFNGQTTSPANHGANISLLRSHDDDE